MSIFQFYAQNRQASKNRHAKSVSVLQRLAANGQHGAKPKGSPMQKIKAAVCHEFGKPLTIDTITLRAPDMGEVEVTLKACAICHSDISFADGGDRKSVV